MVTTDGLGYVDAICRSLRLDGQKGEWHCTQGRLYCVEDQNCKIKVYIVIYEEDSDGRHIVCIHA